MKFRILLISFFICTITSRGQSVWSKPLPPDPSVWTVDNTGPPTPYGCGINGGTYCSTYRYRMAGDTLIGSINYKKLYSTGNFIYHFNGVSGYFTGDSAYFYKGALRQDTIAMKIYLCLPGKTIDTLVYSFHLQVGDTVPASYIYKNSSYSGYTPIVLKIDTILVGSTYYKRFCVGANPTGDKTDPSLIQGIGSTQGYLDMLYKPFEPGRVVTCFNRNKVGAGSNTTECTDAFITGIAEKIIPSFSISSNPSDGLFTLHSNSSFSALLCSVYAIDGRKIVETLVTGTDFPIDIRREPPGMYFLRLQTGELNWSVKLLVK
jgi:hypothetical protein